MQAMTADLPDLPPVERKKAGLRTPVGNARDRRRGIHMATSGEVSGRLSGGSHGRRQI